jgi:hypothetical protein
LRAKTGFGPHPVNGVAEMGYMLLVFFQQVQYHTQSSFSAYPRKPGKGVYCIFYQSGGKNHVLNREITKTKAKITKPAANRRAINQDC